MTNHIWDDDYKALLKGKPKNTWIPWIKGNLGDEEVEISCVHTSEPHGLLSWGWDGAFKIILFDTDINEYIMTKSGRKKLHLFALELAKTVCVHLNETYPQGLR
jgi:hypothetical protein